MKDRQTPESSSDAQLAGLGSHTITEYPSATESGDHDESIWRSQDPNGSEINSAAMIEVSASYGKVQTPEHRNFTECLKPIP